jgi:hypothetical protein
MERRNGNNTAMYGKRKHHTRHEVGRGHQSINPRSDNPSRHVYFQPEIDKRPKNSRPPKRKASEADIDNIQPSRPRRQLSAEILLQLHLSSSLLQFATPMLLTP